MFRLRHEPRKGAVVEICNVMRKTHTSSMGCGFVAMRCSCYLEPKAFAEPSESTSASTRADIPLGEYPSREPFVRSIARTTDLTEPSGSPSDRRRQGRWCKPNASVFPKPVAMPDPMLQVGDFKMMALPASKSGGCPRVTIPSWLRKPFLGPASAAFSGKSWTMAHNRQTSVCKGHGLSTEADVRRAYLSLLLVRESTRDPGQTREIWERSAGIARIRYESGSRNSVRRAAIATRTRATQAKTPGPASRRAHSRSAIESATRGAHWTKQS